MAIKSGSCIVFTIVALTHVSLLVRVAGESDVEKYEVLNGVDLPIVCFGMSEDGEISAFGSSPVILKYRFWAIKINVFWNIVSFVHDDGNVFTKETIKKTDATKNKEIVPVVINQMDAILRKNLLNNEGGGADSEFLFPLTKAIIVTNPLRIVIIDAKKAIKAIMLL